MRAINVTLQAMMAIAAISFVFDITILEVIKYIGGSLVLLVGGAIITLMGGFLIYEMVKMYKKNALEGIKWTVLIVAMWFIGNWG